LHPAALAPTSVAAASDEIRTRVKERTGRFRATLMPGGADAGIDPGASFEKHPCVER
jgi:hypothetical protein